MKHDRAFWRGEALWQHDAIGHLVARVVDLEGISRDDERAWSDRFCEVLVEAERAVQPDAEAVA